VYDYEPGRDGELLAAREVCALLHVARSTLPLWRKRGDLRGYKLASGHWRYPSNQPALAEARAALRAAGAGEK
jgi:predicted site-specific integrase-resolvase